MGYQFLSNDTIYKDVGKINDDIYQFTYLTIDWLRHGFTTRAGGVSGGCCESMNLQMKLQDTPENVRENLRRLAVIAGVQEDSIARLQQVHGNCVVRVDSSWADSPSADAMITNRPDIMLMTLHADCMPVFLADTRNHAIGLCHSGWRGTLAGVAEKMLLAMMDDFGTQPQDVVACIGPSIGPCCFEVGEDVAEQFRDVDVLPVTMSPNGRPMLDLWQAVAKMFAGYGVTVDVAGECTCCQPQYFSHRRQGTERGTMAAFMRIVAE